MEQEQASKASTQMPSAESTQADQTKSLEPTQKAESDPANPYKVFQTQEDYEKAVKSEASKQKLEWMKQAGVSSVDDYKIKISAAEAAIKEHDQLVKEKTMLNDKLIVAELNVADDRKDDLLTLAKTKVTDQKDLRAAAMEVLERNPTWTKGAGVAIKIGTEKAAPSEPHQEDKLSSRYPWLR
jgi:hypothetical protein